MKKKFNIKIYLYCLLLSILVLLFTSKSSPLYPFNDWVDANAFFTVGKSILRGIIPYKDIFEQKGPILYFIFMIGSLVSTTSFIGIFILEVIFMSFTMYFAYLIMRMFLSTRISILLLPIFLVLLTTCKSFSHGSSCEEFMFLFEAITLYYLIRHFKDKKLDDKEYIINGMLAGIILLIKYTSLGLWFSFIFIIFIDYIYCKEYKNGFKSVLYYLLGIFIPIIITLIYFGINHGIKDFINVYFITNITSYSENISLLTRQFMIVKSFIECLVSNNILIILLVLLYPLMVFHLPFKKKEKVYFIILYVFTILGVFYGLKTWPYYALPIIFFILITLIMLVSLSKKYLIKIENRNYYLVLCITIILSFVSSFAFSPNKEYLYIKKEDMLQYKYAKIINKESFVNMGFGDIGIYNMGDIYPSTYFFQLQNFEYNNFRDNIDAFKDYIKNKETKYIVYVRKNRDEVFLEEKTLNKNYGMIEEDVYQFEGFSFIVSLWKVKEI